MNEQSIQAAAIQKSLELSEQDALKVLIFIAGMEAGKALQPPIENAAGEERAIIQPSPP